MRDEIDNLIEEVPADAYNDDEQLSAFAQAFEDNARFPFRKLVIGVEVAVVSVDFEGDERRGLIAICLRAGKPYTVSLLDITPTGPMSVETRRLIDAYRRWSHASPLASNVTENACAFACRAGRSGSDTGGWQLARRSDVARPTPGSGDRDVAGSLTADELGVHSDRSRDT